MVFLNNTIKWRIQELSVGILKQIIAAAKRSGNLILGKTTDLGNDAQFIVFVLYRATEYYVEQFVLLSTCRTYYKKRGQNTAGVCFI